MTLADTGPLVALIAPEDPSHRRCRDLVPALSAPFVTTLPCLTEALYLLGQSGGHWAQQSLLDYRKTGC